MKKIIIFLILLSAGLTDALAMENNSSNFNLAITQEKFFLQSEDLIGIYKDQFPNMNIKKNDLFLKVIFWRDGNTSTFDLTNLPSHLPYTLLKNLKENGSVTVNFKPRNSKSIINHTFQPQQLNVPTSNCKKVEFEKALPSNFKVSILSAINLILTEGL